MSNGDEQFIQSIITTFLSNAPQSVNHIREGIEKTDFEKIRFYAHQLKSSVDFFAVESIQTIVRSVEMEAKQESPNMVNITDWFSQIDSTLNTVFEDLKRLTTA